MKRWLMVAGALVGLALGVHLTLAIVFDADFLADRLNRMLGAESPVQVTIGDRELGFLGGSLTVTDIAFIAADTTGVARPRVTGSVPRLVIEGIDRWTLIVHGGLRVDRLLLERPRVRLASGANKAGSEEVPRPLTERLAGLPPLSAAIIAIDQAQLELPGSDSALTGIDILLKGVEISAAASRFDTMPFSRSLSITMPANRWQTSEAVYELGPVHFATVDSTLRIDRFALLPRDATGRAAEVLALDHQGTQVTLDSLAVRGLAWRGGLEQAHLTARRADLATLSLHAFSGASPQRLVSAPRTMPHLHLHKLPWLVSLDSMRIESAAIRYSELPPDGVEAGTILFADVQATITNISNDPARAGDGPWAHFDVTTRVEDTGRLRVNLRQDLLQEKVDATVDGSLSDLPASAFNPILQPLEALRFTSGNLDTLDFHYALRGHQASGKAHGIFRDLSVEFLGDDGDPGIKETFKGLLGNLFILRTESRRAFGMDTPRIVDIEYTREDDDTYIKFLWVGLRSGLKNLIGI
jgi:hypothetical protein